MAVRSHEAKLLRSFVKKYATWGGFNKFQYRDALAVDIEVRQLIEKTFPKSAVLGVNIDRPAKDKFFATILTSKTEEIMKDEAVLNKLKNKLKDLVPDRKEVILNIQEPHNIEIFPQLYAEEVVEELEKKGNLRVYINKLFARLKRGGSIIKGIRIIVGGRLSGSTMARRKIYSFGSVSKKTISEYVDECTAQAITTSGTCGVRVTLQARRVDATTERIIKERQYNAHTPK